MEKICINCFKEITKDNYRYNKYFCGAECETEYLADTKELDIEEFLRKKYDLPHLTKEIHSEIEVQSRALKTIIDELKPFGNALKKITELQEKIVKISTVVDAIDTKAVEKTNIANGAKEYFSKRQNYEKLRIDYQKATYIDYSKFTKEEYEKIPGAKK